MVDCDKYFMYEKIFSEERVETSSNAGLSATSHVLQPYFDRKKNRKEV